MSSSIQTKIIRSNRKTLSMKVMPDSSLVVSAPYLIPKFLIDKFIKDNSHWIEKQLLKLNTQRINKKSYQNGEKFLFLGKEYSLLIGNYPSIFIKNDQILFPNIALFRADKEISSWYIKNANKIIFQQLNECSRLMNVEYSSVMFSDTKSKWGSCTADNRLQFNWKLVMAPILVIRYVIIHELSHIKYKNHSRSFWNQVRLYNPSYKQQIKWLKENGHKLTLA